MHIQDQNVQSMLNNPTFIVELPNNIPYGHNPIATIPITDELVEELGLEFDSRVIYIDALFAKNQNRPSHLRIYNDMGSSTEKVRCSRMVNYASTLSYLVIEFISWHEFKVYLTDSLGLDRFHTSFISHDFQPHVRFFKFNKK
nr:MAG TPA: hypothetical protein [Caudoviricetes sp.]